MIVRHVNYIEDRKLKSTIQIFEIDPQLKFICVNVPQQYTIYLIDLNEFSIQLQVSMLHFAKTKIYSSKLAVEAITQIDTSKDKSKSGVLLIKISPIWQNRQFLAYSTIQRIHIYEIHNNNNQIIIKPYQILLINDQSPVSAIRFYYSALYLGHYNDDMKIYQIDYKKNLWYQSDSIVKMTHQFLRIAIYDDDCNQQNNKLRKVKSVNRRKSTNNFNQEKLQRSQLRKQHPKFQRLLSIDQIMLHNNIEYQNLSQQNDEQPVAPILLYQRKDNSLWMAEYDHQDKEYVHIQLCPPLAYDYGPIIDDRYYLEEQFGQGEQMKMQMKSKTPGKFTNNKTSQQSLKKTPGQHSQRKTQGMKEQASKKSKNRYSSVKKLYKQQDEDYNQQEEDIIVSDPLMFRLTMCQNYIIYDTQISYKLLSREADWNQIYEDVRQPCVNSFFQKIEQRVFMEILYRMGGEFCDELMTYLGENYEFVMVGFPTPKIYGNDHESAQLSILKVELLVVDKVGGKEEKHEKGLRLDIIQGILQMERFFNMNESEINEVYDDQMVMEIKQRMQTIEMSDKKENKKTSNSKNKKNSRTPSGTSLKKNKKNDNSINKSGQKMRTRQKSPLSKKYHQQKHQQQQNNIGGYNLRIRSSKQKPSYVEKNQLQNRQKKSNNKSSNKSNIKVRFQLEEQIKYQQQLQPQIQPIPTINQYPHTYTFPIFEFEYLKNEPLRMQWIGENEILLICQQRRLHYFTVHPNIIYSILSKIYLYLYWIQFRDDLDPFMIQSFKRVIEDFVMRQQRNMQREFDDNNVKIQQKQQYEEQIDQQW